MASYASSQTKMAHHSSAQARTLSAISNQTPTAAPTSANPERWPCTFQGCLKVFKEKIELINHKIFASEHDYCKRCDLDFENDDRLTLHKLQSSKHIVCPVCYGEFKSTGGRDLHIRTLHKSEQKLVCVGCTTIFTRAGALMAHIEKGQCRNIPSQEFEVQRVKKELMKATMLREDEDRESLGVPSEPDDEAGGVAITATGGDPDDLIDLSLRLPTKRDRESAIVAGYIKAPDLHFPTLPSQPRPASVTKTSASQSTRQVKNPEPVDLLAEGLRETDINAEPRWAGESVVKLFPGAKSKTIVDWTVDVAKNADKLQGPEVMSSTLSTYESPHEEVQQWNPYEYLNALTGLFTCPHKACARAYPTVKDFEGHLRSAAHTGGTIRCPSCLRIFKTTAALVSHCESATRRCKISKSAQFRQIIDHISGGLLEAETRFADGTIKFNAPDREFW